MSGAGQRKYYIRHCLYAAGTCLLLATTMAHAHHSFVAQFDVEKEVVLQGTVTKVEWLSPHVYIYLDVTAADGSRSVWKFEMAAPQALQNRGWNRSLLNIGDIVEVDGALARDGSQLVNAYAVLFVDSGRRLSASTTQTPSRE